MMRKETIFLFASQKMNGVAEVTSIRVNQKVDHGDGK